MYFPGHRSGTAEPILWVIGLVVGGVAVLLVVLTITHAHSPGQPADTAVVPSTVAPAPAPAPAPARPAPAAPPCYPFEPC